MIGDDGAWDTGLQVHGHFATLTEAAQLLRTSWHHQDEYVGSLYPHEARDGLRPPAMKHHP